MRDARHAPPTLPARGIAPALMRGAKPTTHIATPPMAAPPDHGPHGCRTRHWALDHPRQRGSVSGSAYGALLANQTGRRAHSQHPACWALDEAERRKGPRRWSAPRGLVRSRSCEPASTRTSLSHPAIPPMRARQTVTEMARWNCSPPPPAMVVSPWRSTPRAPAPCCEHVCSASCPISPTICRARQMRRPTDRGT